MPSWELLETRRISGKGLLLVPDVDLPYRRYALVADVYRPPRNISVNLNITPVESFYGRLAFRWQGRVISTRSIKYVSQTWQFEPDICGQTIIALKCVIDTHNQSIINLGVAQGLPPISVNNPLEAFSVQSLEWDEVVLTCFADSAVRLQLWALPYQYCSPYSVFVDPGSPETDFPESVPPGTPLEGEDELSPPYEEPDDGGLTIPYPGDTPVDPEPPSGTWFITWTYVQTPGLSPCPYIGSPDTFTKTGTATDVFGLVDEGSGGSRIWRLTQNGVPDAVTLVEYRCTPTFSPPPVFTPDS